jgi:hypothetical protein
LSAEFAAISNEKAPRPHDSSRGAFDGLGRRRKPGQIVHDMMNNIRPEMAKSTAGEVMAGSFSTPVDAFSVTKSIRRRRGQGQPGRVEWVVTLIACHGAVPIGERGSNLDGSSATEYWR